MAWLSCWMETKKVSGVTRSEAMRKQGPPLPVNVGDELLLLSGDTVSGTVTVEKLTPTQIVTDKGRFRRDGGSLNRYSARFHVAMPAN